MYNRHLYGLHQVHQLLTFCYIYSLIISVLIIIIIFAEQFESVADSTPKFFIINL